MHERLQASDVAMTIQIDDCWNRIGVRGDSTCPKLQDYLRCLNCPTYAAGASALLDRPVTADELISDWGQGAQSLALSLIHI